MPGSGLLTGVPPESASIRPTTPFEGQKPGTSGLRKKTKEFIQPGYLSNYVQAVFDCLPQSEVRGGTLLVAGDGRYFCDLAVKKIASIAAGNGVGRVWIAKDGLATTPACSAILRLREGGVAFGGFILTASHNPGGLDADFGVKYNTANGAPALEGLTDRIYDRTKEIKEIKHVKLLDFDLDTLGTTVLIREQFKIEIIDGVEDWLRLMKAVFHFPALRHLISSPNFSFVFDGMHGVGGPAAKRLFVDELGANANCLHACNPLPDFGGGHPDPNLEYAKNLVSTMHVKDPENVSETTPLFGAAGDGDCDRNMILGRGFFVTPSDSVAIIALYAEKVIPFFMKNEQGGGITGLARSMPTSMALDGVAKKLGKDLYETPTGWKFFTNLMDAGRLSICGEESFGTGSIHVREKDGLWAVLAWLSILAYRNGFMNNIQSELADISKGIAAKTLPPQNIKQPFISVQQIVEEFWRELGRNYYMRYDYENKCKITADRIMQNLSKLAAGSHQQLEEWVEASVPPELRQAVPSPEKIDVFKYTDPVDGSVSDNQGIQLFFPNGRVVWRLSGTGSSGATIRVYFEQRVAEPDSILQPASKVLECLIQFALEFCKMKQYLGSDVPTVIT